MEPQIDTIHGLEDPPRLSIVIPAYNEVRRLPATLERLHSYLATQPYTVEIIVVSNGSTDGTEDMVREFSRRAPQVKLRVASGRGKGLAVRDGVLHSRGEVVFLCDADMSMPPETLSSFLLTVERADVVLGSREAPGARRFQEPGYRHFMGRVFNYVVRVLTVRGISDTQAGFKAFRRDPAMRLFGMQTIKGWGFDVEILFLARKLGFEIVELPIDWYFDADTRVRPGIDTISMVREVLVIRWRAMRGKYDLAPPTVARLGGGSDG